MRRSTERSGPERSHWNSHRSTAWANLGAVRALPDSLPVWALRAAWVLVPLAAGPALDAALDGRSAPVQVVAAVIAWLTWVVVLVATLVPRASSLTVVRLGVPAALAAAVWAAGPGAPDDDLARGAAALVASAVAVAVAAAPSVADAFVNGSAYGAERRFALRCPPLLLVLAAGARALVGAGVVAGPLLLAAGAWAAGAGATVVGAAVAVAGTRAVHGLSRRWLVFVPSGVVVHDPIARPESVMAPRPLIERLAPAAADSDALDLTLGAPGLALELATSEVLPVTVRRGRRQLGTEEATRVLVAPARPAAVLAEAATRRIPVA